MGFQQTQPPINTKKIKNARIKRTARIPQSYPTSQNPNRPNNPRFYYKVTYGTSPSPPAPQSTPSPPPDPVCTPTNSASNFSMCSLSQFLALIMMALLCAHFLSECFVLFSDLGCAVLDFLDSFLY